MPRTFPGLRPGPSPLTQSAFRPEWFREQNFGQGHNLRWEHALRCPCATVYPSLTADAAYTAMSNVPDENCPSGCRGTGYLYYGAQDIVGLVHDTAADPQFLQVYGELMQGSCGITLQPEHLPKKFDRFVDLDEVRPHTEFITRTGASDRLTYPVAVETITAGGDADDTVPTPRVRGVQCARRATADGALVDGEVVEGEDFDVVDGIIVWRDDGSNVPAIGERVSFDYNGHPTYIARRFPHLGRTAPVLVAPPNINVDGFRGFWDASGGSLPSGAGVAQGDYFEVSVAGTAAGVPFVVGDQLLALVDVPSGSYASNWLRLDGNEPQIEMQHLPTMALCWLEDLGDPFGRAGIP